jgi:hypothetical protein
MSPADAAEHMGFHNSEKLLVHKHSVTNHLIELHAYMCREPMPDNAGKYVGLSELNLLPMPSPQRVVAAALLESGALA